MAKASTKPPYTLLARFYDRLTEEAPAMHRHARQKILGEILPRVRTVCDLGCGTGSTAMELARRGLKVFAVDLSPAMCRLARRKARRAGLPIKVLCADMRSLRLPEPVDLVLSEFNPLNHLPRKADLERVARAVSRALRPGGYFCFDLNTPRTYEELSAFTRWVDERDFSVVIHGGFNPPRDKAWVQFEWFIPDGRHWRRYRERVVDVCWTDSEIRRALRQAGFHHIRSWDGAQVRPASREKRNGYDTYYLAQKPLRG